MIEKKYFCTGGCGAVISEEEYVDGLNTCGTKGCSHFGHPFEERKYCTVCKETFKASHKHKNK